MTATNRVNAEGKGHRTGRALPAVRRRHWLAGATSRAGPRAVRREVERRRTRANAVAIDMNQKQIEKAITDLARSQLKILDEVNALRAIYMLTFITQLDQNDRFRVVIRQTLETLLSYRDIDIEPQLDRLLRDFLSLASGDRLGPLPGITPREPPLPSPEAEEGPGRPHWLRGVIEGGRHTPADGSHE